MKKRMLIISVTVIVLLFLSSFVSVFSVQADAMELKPPDKTPGAKATEKAIQRANEGKGKQKVNYQGIIAAVSEASLDLTLADSTVVTFTLNESTQIKIPTLGKNATVADLVVGAQIKVRAQKDGDALLALSINIIPGKPVKVHRVGIVTEYTAGESITIQGKDGEPCTFLLSEGTKVLPADRAEELKVGSLVTIICPRDVAGGKLLATGIVVHPEGTAKGAFPEVTETVTEEAPEE